MRDRENIFVKTLIRSPDTGLYRIDLQYPERT